MKQDVEELMQSAYAEPISRWRKKIEIKTRAQNPFSCIYVTFSANNDSLNYSREIIQ